MSAYEAAAEIRDPLQAIAGDLALIRRMLEDRHYAHDELPPQAEVRVFTRDDPYWLAQEVNAFLAGFEEADVLRVGDAIPYRSHVDDRPYDAWSCTVVVRRHRAAS